MNHPFGLVIDLAELTITGLPRAGGKAVDGYLGIVTVTKAGKAY